MVNFAWKRVTSLRLYKEFTGTTPQRNQQFTNGSFILRQRKWGMVLWHSEFRGPHSMPECILGGTKCLRPCHSCGRPERNSRLWLWPGPFLASVDIWELARKLTVSASVILPFKQVKRTLKKTIPPLKKSINKQKDFTDRVKCTGPSVLQVMD